MDLYNLENNFRKNQGFTLLETLVALAILGIIVLAAVLALTQGFTFWSVGEKEAVVQNEIEKALSQIVDGDAEGRFGIRGARSIDSSSNTAEIVFYDEDNNWVKYDRDAGQRLRRTLADGSVQFFTSSDVRVNNLEFHYFGLGTYPDPPSPTPTPAEVLPNSASLVKVEIEVEHAREESEAISLISAGYRRYSRIVLLSISAVRVRGISLQSATVTWVTNKSADGRVNYGVTTGLGSTVYDANLVTNHALDISLTQEVRYYYEVRSTTGGGETAAAGIYSFRLYTPSAVTVLPGGGSAGGGDVNSLRRSDNNYYRVNSTITAPCTADWQATITGVETPPSAVRLSINYEGRWQGQAAQPTDRDLILYLWNFSSNNWDQISVTTLKRNQRVLITPPPIDNPVNYISSGGEIRIRVYMDGGSPRFFSDGDLMLITVEYL